MKKVNIIFVFILILFANACNKESIIEGAIVSPTIVSINKSVLLNTATLTPISLNIGGNPVTFQTQYIAIKATAGFSNVTVTNDSVRFNNFLIAAGPFSISGTQGTNGVAVINKLSKGADFPEGYTYTGNPYFVISKKSAPYTSPFVSITSNVTFSSGTSFTPQFSLASDGYMAFKHTTGSATAAVNYYGWIHVIVSQNEITFDKYGYQKDFPIKIGQEE